MQWGRQVIQPIGIFIRTRNGFGRLNRVSQNQTSARITLRISALFMSGKRPLYSRRHRVHRCWPSRRHRVHRCWPSHRHRVHRCWPSHRHRIHRCWPSHRHRIHHCWPSHRHRVHRPTKRRCPEKLGLRFAQHRKNASRSQGSTKLECDITIFHPSANFSKFIVVLPTTRTFEFG